MHFAVLYGLIMTKSFLSICTEYYLCYRNGPIFDLGIEHKVESYGFDKIYDEAEDDGGKLY